jgi:hypothetical protein
MMGRLFLGKEGAEGAARIAESSRQRREIKTAVRQADAATRKQGAVSEERARLIEQARATHARVDSEMDPATREQLRKTASKLMKGKGN